MKKMGQLQNKSWKSKKEIPRIRIKKLFKQIILIKNQSKMLNKSNRKEIYLSKRRNRNQKRHNKSKKMNKKIFLLNLEVKIFQK